jgi:hypothetical protein
MSEPTNIAIVALVSRAYQALADITIEQNKRPYCALHGYRFLEYNIEATDAKKAGYDRLERVIEAMKSKDYIEWFWCQGVDTMIMNFTIRMESFVDPNYHLIIARDCYSLNGDSVLIRNTRQGLHLLYRMISERDWYEDMANAPYADCSAYDDLSKDPKWKHLIKVVPQKSFNSADYTLYNMPELLGHPGQFSSGDFLLHWGGISNERRMQLAQDHLGKVIK